GGCSPAARHPRASGPAAASYAAAAARDDEPARRSSRGARCRPPWPRTRRRSDPPAPARPRSVRGHRRLREPRFPATGRSTRPGAREAPRPTSRPRRFEERPYELASLLLLSRVQPAFRSNKKGAPTREGRKAPFRQNEKLLSVKL